LTNNNWFSKSILYWDEIQTIVPDSYSWEPERLMPFTRNLIKSGLITQAFPYDCNINYDLLREKMLEIINSKAFEIDKKRENFELGNYDFIHKDKFVYEIFDDLIMLKLAKEKEHSGWYYVELETTRILMWLLATVMGYKTNSNPSTDQGYYFSNVFYENFEGYEKQQVRKIIVEDLLPFPTNPNFENLSKFKNKNRGKLTKFRQEVESLIDVAAEIEDSEKRVQKGIELAEKLKAEKEELVAKLEESKTGKVLKSMVGGAIITSGTMWYLETITPLLGGTAGAVVAGTKAYLDNPIKDKKLEYIALLDKEIKEKARS